MIFCRILGIDKTVLMCYYLIANKKVKEHNYEKQQKQTKIFKCSKK